MAHAALGASGAYRWRACPGSIRMCRDLPSKSSEFARVGTVAHYLAEVCLRKRHPPEHYLGLAVDPEHPDIVVDDDMVEAVTVYLSFLAQHMRAPAKSSVFWIEARVSLEAMGGIGEQMFGTADFIFYDKETCVLWVVDYKHGSGVPVEVTGSDQLRYYAFGALLRLWKEYGRAAPVKQVIYTVVQPRCEHPDGPIRSEEIDTVDLMDWGDDLLLAAEKTQEPDAPLNPGGHCRFCDALSVCPAVRDQRMEQAKLYFTQDDDVQTHVPLDQLTVDELRIIVDNADGIIAWVKSAKEMAQTRLENGLDMPGYKLVAKRPVRSWALPEQELADKLCGEFGLGDDEMFKRTLLSPAQMEKALKADKQTKEFLSAFVKSESSGTTLAPDGDKRPAVKAEPRPAPQDVFEELD